ncbi:hypothetical protein CCACVL1_07127, partial [Corchorus capsularis]
MTKTYGEITRTMQWRPTITRGRSVALKIL